MALDAVAVAADLASEALIFSGNSKFERFIVKSCIVAGIGWLAYKAYQHGAKVAEERQQASAGMQR